MPRSAEQLKETSEKAVGVAEKIREGAVGAVDKAAADFPEAARSLHFPPRANHERIDKTAQEASQDYDPIATAKKLAAKHGVRQHYPPEEDLYSLVNGLIGESKPPPRETREYREIVKATKEYQTGSKDREVKAAKKKVGEIEVDTPEVPEEEKAEFGDEEQRAFWSEASEKLTALEAIAGKSVASRLGRLAGQRAIEEAGKFVSPDHKSAIFKIELGELDRWIEEEGRHAHHRAGRTAEMKQRFPQTNPANYDATEELKTVEAVIEDLRAAVASEKYLTRLDPAVGRYVAKLRGSQSSNAALKAPEAPNYPPEVTRQVDAQIEKLRGEGLASKQIRRRLAARYHPDVNEGGDTERTRQFAGYVNEWYEEVLKEENKK